MNATRQPLPAEGGPLHVSLFLSARDARPVWRGITWSALVVSLSRFTVHDALPWACATKGCDGTSPPGLRVACPSCGEDTMELDKRALPAWSPAVFRGTRARANVVGLSCLVVDHDDGDALDAIAARWSSWPHLLHTSWRHTDAHPKARVVVPLGRPVGPEVFPRLWAWALARDPTIDRKCSDPSRLYFRPAIRSADWPHEVRVHDEPTRFLDVEDLDLPKVEVPAPRVVHRDPLCWPTDPDRAARLAYKTSPDARRARAAEVGARLVGSGSGERAKGATCPKCGRPSVWWPIEPVRLLGAACDHRSSCGWTGWLDQLGGAT